MANLLNSAAKKGVSTEYKMRIISITILLIALCVIAACVLLIPNLLNKRSELQTINYKIESIKQSDSSVIDPETQQLSARLNARTNFLRQQKGTATERYIEYLEVMAILPQSLDYARISFTTKSEEANKQAPVEAATLGENEELENMEAPVSVTAQESEVSVSGIASTRSVLADAITDLQKIDWVKSVDYPLSDLGKAADIDFSITVTYSPEEIPAVIEFLSLLKPGETNNLDVAQPNSLAESPQEAQPEASMADSVESSELQPIDSSDSSTLDGGVDSPQTAPEEASPIELIEP